MDYFITSLESFYHNSLEIKPNIHIHAFTVDVMVEFPNDETEMVIFAIPCKDNETEIEKYFVKLYRTLLCKCKMFRGIKCEHDKDNQKYYIEPTSTSTINNYKVHNVKHDVITDERMELKDLVILSFLDMWNSMTGNDYKYIQIDTPCHSSQLNLFTTVDFIMNATDEGPLSIITDNKFEICEREEPVENDAEIPKEQVSIFVNDDGKCEKMITEEMNEEDIEEYDRLTYDKESGQSIFSLFEHHANEEYVYYGGSNIFHCYCEPDLNDKPSEELKIKQTSKDGKHNLIDMFRDECEIQKTINKLDEIQYYGYMKTNDFVRNFANEAPHIDSILSDDKYKQSYLIEFE